MYKIDNLDKTILLLLLEDSRKKFSQIAEKCGVSESTIKKRYSKLKKTGIIKKSTAIVNAKKMGYQAHLSVNVDVNFCDIEKFMKFVNSIKGATSYNIELNSKYSVHALIPIKNKNEIEICKKQVLNHPSVISISENVWTDIEIIPKNLSALRC